MKTISINIKSLRAEKKISQEQFAMELGVPRSRISAYEEGRAEPNIDFLILLSDYFKISIDALVRFNLSKTDKTSFIKIGQNRMLLPVLVDDKGNDKIEVVSAKASAGYLNGYADPEFIEGLNTMKLPYNVVGKSRAFAIKGNSMPPANTGDFVVGKYVENINEIVDGNTYIIVTKTDGISYKRLYIKGTKAAGSFELHSDNKEYQPYTVSKADVLEVWEYVCLLRKSNAPDNITIDGVINFLKGMKL